MSNPIQGSSTTITVNVADATGNVVADDVVFVYVAPDGTPTTLSVGNGDFSASSPGVYPVTFRVTEAGQYAWSCTAQVGAYYDVKQGTFEVDARITG